MKIIELKDISFRYSDEEVNVITNFSYSFEKGKCYVIEGDNGSGKTTLFQILNGLYFPQCGKYVFDGNEISEKYLKDNRKAKLFHKEIGYLFQNPDVMLFNASVYDEVAFGPRQMGLSENEVNKRTEDCLKLFKLEGMSLKAPYHLSGGEKKRVALASIMSLNPEVLILDEPFAGLDSDSNKSLMEFLVNLKQVGKTILIATHNLDVKEKLADEVLTIKR